jgi:DNA-binding transcriptional MerR regulator/quercetin dioxygenase-like cupin family protein
LSSENEDVRPVPVGALSIGALSRRTGVSPSTLRDWEQYGIVQPTRIGTHRRYSQDDVIRVTQALELRQRNFSPVAIAAMFDSAGEQASRRASADIGQRLRQARLARRLRLSQVSAAVGISVSHLSVLERSGSVPSVSVLQRLAQFLDLDLADLFGGEPDLSTPRVGSADSARPIVSDDGRVRIRPVARGTMMCSDLYEASPGGSSGEHYTHVGEECVYVIEGTAEFSLGDEPPRLVRAGETLAFDSSIPHRWRNPGDATLRMFWSNARPATIAMPSHNVS